MGYVNDNLVNGEHVKYSARSHWIEYVNFVAAAAVPAGIMLPFHGGGALVLFIFLLIPLLPIPFIRSKTTEMAVTNKRVIMKQGLIRRATLELKFGRIEQVSVDQGIFGRLLGYGDIKLCGTGGSLEIFRNVSDPLTFRNQVNVQMDRESMRPAAPEIRPN
jgi:uncharacterized membrane protein YdbT with pleckstrin-like domain